MIYIEAFALLFGVLAILIWLSYTEDKQYRVRYAPIIHRMIPGRRYPFWRLEEMLKEEQEKNK